MNVHKNPYNERHWQTGRQMRKLIFAVRSRFEKGPKG